MFNMIKEIRWNLKNIIKTSDYQNKNAYLKINEMSLLDKGYIIIEIKNTKD